MNIQSQLFYCKAWVKQKVGNNRGQFALDIALGLAVVLVISAFIVLPGLRDLCDLFIKDMTAWWSKTMNGQIFKTSGK
jgi:hypothetical protein